MIRAFEYLTNLAVRYPLPNPLPRGEGIRLLKIRGRVGLAISWQVNPKMFGLNSLIPSPRGKGLGRGAKQAAGLPLWQKIQPCQPNKSISESIFMQNQAKL